MMSKASETMCGDYGAPMHSSYKRRVSSGHFRNYNNMTHHSGMTPSGVDGPSSLNLLPFFLGGGEQPP